MDASSMRTAFLKIASSSSSSTCSSMHLFLSSKLIRNPQPLHSSHSRYPLSCPRLMLPHSRSNSRTNLNCKSSHFEDFLAPTIIKSSSNSLSLTFTRNFITRPRFFADSSFERSSNVHFPIFSRLPISSSSRNLPFLKMGGTRNAFTSAMDEKYHVWHREFDSKPVDRPFGLAVVLLGWLGAERKHLNRYAEWYASGGIQPITFVVSVMDLLGFDVGSSIEQSLAVLSNELMVWLMDREEDGRERRLLVHTFSNTGWFAYGVILENIQLKGNMIEKIKGCVIDSGPEPELNPLVWASGFAAALVRKRNSLINNPSSKDIVNHNAAMIQETKTPIAENLLLVTLEKFFSVVLKIPAVKQKLDRRISTLSYKQPACPQLYLYSRADKVVPWQSIERFMDLQKGLGNIVISHDFVSSPHVDHLRTFPNIYLAQLQGFLDECVPAAKI